MIDKKKYKLIIIFNKMCINYIYYTFFNKQKYNKQTQTSVKSTSTRLTQTNNNNSNNNNNVLIQTELNMENLMDSNEDWYKLVWTNSNSNSNYNDELINFKY